MWWNKKQNIQFSMMDWWRYDYFLEAQIKKEMALIRSKDNSRFEIIKKSDLNLRKQINPDVFDEYYMDLIIERNKLKNTDKMVKQTIYTVPDGVEVEQIELDGNKVVITFKDKDIFVPKDGDVCVGSNSSKADWIYIFRSKMDSTRDKFHVILCNDKLKFNDWCSIGLYPNGSTKQATPQESAKLFTAMAKAGYKWNAEEKKVEKIRWRAKNGEKYWFSNVDANRGETLYKPCETTENSGLFDNSMFKQGDYHKTKEDSQIYCNKLNEAIQNLNQWR